MDTSELEMAIKAAGKVQRHLIEAVLVQRGAGRQMLVDRALLSLETLENCLGRKAVQSEDA